MLVGLLEEEYWMFITLAWTLTRWGSTRSVSLPSSPCATPRLYQTSFLQNLKVNTRRQYEESRNLSTDDNIGSNTAHQETRQRNRPVADAYICRCQPEADVETQYNSHDTKERYYHRCHHKTVNVMHDGSFEKQRQRCNALQNDVRSWGLLKSHHEATHFLLPHTSCNHRNTE